MAKVQERCKSELRIVLPFERKRSHYFGVDLFGIENEIETLDFKELFSSLESIYARTPQI